MDSAQLDSLLHEEVDEASLDMLRNMMLFHVPTTGTSSDEHSTSSPPPAAPKPKRTRKRESHELAYLREKVGEYTAQLEALQRRKDRAAEMASPWETVSRRQASERYIVEQENAKLKQALEQQRDIAQTLLEIVTKRPRLMETPYIADTKVHRLVKEPVDVRRATAEAIVEADYARLESIFLTRKLHETTEMIQNTAIAYDEATGAIRMDCTMCETQHVNFERCGDAIWKLYNDLVPVDVKDTYFDMLEEWDADTTYGRLVMTTRGTEVQSHTVQKRFVEPNRIVICSSTIAEDELHPYKDDAYILHESTWLAIEKLEENKTRVKFCSRGAVPCAERARHPTVFEPKPSGEKQRIPHYVALAEFMLSCYQAHFDGIKQALESMLHPHTDVHSRPDAVYQI
ncbi:hypothetical protein ACHHYP_09639 [Achlya hypogyna]|uniref:M96 mating-specific protein family n=1 Tax=Achlya hypogyna TaxID=1202772 RepID=A0A1V9YMR8_ACHHY|nr:hypothetical protein ACHHYP_09639 [Achlya hypogyna]